MFLFQTFPAEWIEFYHTRGLVMKDPAMHWAFANKGHIRWRDLNGADPAEVMENARRHGLAYGFTTSLHDKKSRSLAGFAREDRDFLDVEIDEIFRLFTELHKLTEGLEVLSQWDLDALQKMSIRMTRGLM
ncbi:MAG: autoinducer binding domain-containing protein [Pseudomonadota bacterium]